MHELGIMTGVVDSVTQAARHNGATKILKVSLAVGEMTEAIEDALQFAFEALTDRDPFFEGAELCITMVEPRSRCLECGTEFAHDRFHVTCPACGGFAELIQGKDLRIESIEVDIPEDESDDPAEPNSPDEPDKPDGANSPDEPAECAACGASQQ